MLNHEELSREETKDIIIGITQSEFPEEQITALLTGLQMRGVTVDELLGFRDGILATGVPAILDCDRYIDVVGTGGDRKNTFNISTTSCFVIAGAGYKVAKHGNYAATSVSGASNVIRNHGVQFTDDMDKLNRSINEAGIVYLHAQLFAKAMKFVGPIRKALQFPTVFNLLGPLVNPSQPKCQLLGVANLDQMRLYNQVYQKIGIDYGIVNSIDGYDEISLTSDFKVTTNNYEKIFKPQELGFELAKPEEVRGGATEEEASITVSTSINNMTRVATDAKGGQTFEEGDEISVYAWTGAPTVAPETSERVVNNAINKLTNGSWVSTPQMLWKNNRDKHYFIGVYPTAAISDLTAGEYTFDVTKQTESDLLVAVNPDGLSYSADAQQTVPLTFTHVMAKLVVNLTYKNQWGTEGPAVDKVAVVNAAKKATVNYLTKVVTPSAVAEDKADFDMPVLTANKKYASIIIPQDGVQKIIITIGGKDFIYDNGTPFKFESGKITTINLVVGRDQVILDEVKISNWTEGSTFGGEALD